jgi:hypothetical protein
VTLNSGSSSVASITVHEEKVLYTDILPQFLALETPRGSILRDSQVVIDPRIVCVLFFRRYKSKTRRRQHTRVLVVPPENFRRRGYITPNYRGREFFTV